MGAAVEGGTLRCKMQQMAVIAMCDASGQKAVVGGVWADVAIGMRNPMATHRAGRADMSR